MPHPGITVTGNNLPNKGTALTEEELKWTELWFCYLWANTNYYDYCAAKRKGDTGTVEKLEGSYKKIGQIYSDWEDIYHSNSPEPLKFSDWIKSHEHLFKLDNDAVRLLKRITLSDDATVIAIPHSLEKDQAVKQVNELLSAQLSPGVHRPKYSVHPKGRITSRQVEGLEKSFYIYCLHKYKKPGIDKNNSDATISLDLHLMDDYFLSWKLNEFEQKKFLEGELNKSDFESKIHQVLKYRQRAEKIIENTIHGVFPCDKDVF